MGTCVPIRRVGDPRAAVVTTPDTSSVLPPAEAYRLWAATYGAENAVSDLERRAAEALTPPLARVRLLDVGCGTGRRLDEARAAGARVVGVDLVEAMLRRAAVRELPGALAVADVRALPFPAARFDVVWCRLVLGHVPALEVAYAELARVLRPEGTLVVTDFHPAAARAGHQRTFRDAGGLLRAVEHHVHDPHEHLHAAAAAGLRPVGRDEPAVGPAVEAWYQAASALERYRADQGLPLVLALAFRG